MYTVGPGTLEAFNSKCYILVIAVTVNINIGQLCPPAHCGTSPYGKHELVLALGVLSGYKCKTPWNPGDF